MKHKKDNKKCYHQFDLQKKGVKIMSIVNNSSLPRSIRIEKIHLAESGTHSKLSTGPSFPIAGPTLPRVVATPPIAVRKSTPVMVMAKDPKINAIR